METLKNLWTNFWYWLRPQLNILLSDMTAEVMRIALEEVKKLIGTSLPNDVKQASAAEAIRIRMKASGYSDVATNLINQAIEQAVGILKR